MATRGQLIIELDGHLVQTVDLLAIKLMIGRTPDNDLALPAAQVSRRHAEIQIEKEGPVLTDLGSVNGTFIGGLRLLPHQPRLLTDGEVFEIGPYLIFYRSPQPIEPVGIVTPDELNRTIEQKREPTASLRTAIAEEVLLPALIKPPRQTWPAELTTREADSAYLRHLPAVFQDSDFLRRFLLIFEQIWEPMEQRQDEIAMYFDPRTCPASLLDWLASWLDLKINPDWPEGRMRALLADAVELYRWRGTKYGLVRMIEICTGQVVEITETEAPFVFHIKLKPAKDDGLKKDLIEELIRTHKPAHAGYEFEVQTWKT
jgi:phage tail-like protein